MDRRGLRRDEQSCPQLAVRQPFRKQRDDLSLPRRQLGRSLQRVPSAEAALERGELLDPVPPQRSKSAAAIAACSLASSSLPSATRAPSGAYMSRAERGRPDLSACFADRRLVAVRGASSGSPDASRSCASASSRYGSALGAGRTHPVGNSSKSAFTSSIGTPPNSIARTTSCTSWGSVPPRSVAALVRARVVELCRVEVTPAGGDVQAESAPPLRPGTDRRIELREDGFGAIDLAGFERQPCRVSAIPRCLVVLLSMPVGPDRLLDVGERRAEVALPLGQVGESVPVAAREQVEAGSLVRFPHPNQQGTSLVRIGPVIVTAYEVVEATSDDHPLALGRRLLDRLAEQSDPFIDHRRGVHEGRGPLDLGAHPYVRQVEPIGQLDGLVSPLRGTFEIVVQHAHLGEDRQRLAPLGPVVELLDERGQTLRVRIGRFGVTEVVVQPADEPERGRFGLQISRSSRRFEAPLCMAQRVGQEAGQPRGAGRRS